MFLTVIWIIQYIIMEFQSAILEFKLNSQLHFEAGCYCSINLYFHLSTVNPHIKPKISNLTSTKLLLNSFSWFYTNPVFKDYRETTLFISMDYSYNPTSEPLHLVWLTWWVLHLIISGLYSIPLSLFKE